MKQLQRMKSTHPMVHFPSLENSTTPQPLFMTRRPPTCMVERALSVVSGGGARRRPLAQQGVHAVSVAPDGSEDQRGSARLVLLVHLAASLQQQQHLQGLSVAVVRLQRRLQRFTRHCQVDLGSNCDDTVR